MHTASCICMAGRDWETFGAGIRASLDASASRGAFDFVLIVCITVHKKSSHSLLAMPISSITCVSDL